MKRPMGPINCDRKVMDGSNEPLIRSSSRNSLNQSTSSGSRFGYEEFDKKLKVKCPTCQGKGKLSQSQADTLVALIPVSDKRLRPRRTKLYLGITVILCILAISLVAFFLLPRSIALNILEVVPVKIYMKNVPYIDVKVVFEVKNDNYFEATVTDLSTDINWNRFILNVTMPYQKDFSVHPRASKNHSIILRQIFSGDEVMRRVKFICPAGWQWKLLEKFSSTATVSYLARSEQVTNTFYGYVACHNYTALM